MQIQKFYFELIEFFNQVNVSSGNIDVSFIWIDIKNIKYIFPTQIPYFHYIYYNIYYKLWIIKHRFISIIY